MCAYAAGNVEHFKYLMRSLGYMFKPGAWVEVQALGYRYYHSLAKMDEMFAENKLKHVHELRADEESYVVTIQKEALAKLIVVSEMKRVELKELIHRILEKGIEEYEF